MCYQDEIGLAFDRAGMADSAIVAYERFLETPFYGQFFWEDAAEKPWILERLGQLYDERGDHERVLRYYAEFVELWGDADPEFQPRVEAAQRRIDEIMAVRG